MQDLEQDRTPIQGAGILRKSYMGAGHGDWTATPKQGARESATPKLGARPGGRTATPVQGARAICTTKWVQDQEAGPRRQQGVQSNSQHLHWAQDLKPARITRLATKPSWGLPARNILILDCCQSGRPRRYPLVTKSHPVCRGAPALPREEGLMMAMMIIKAHAPGRKAH